MIPAGAGVGADGGGGGVVKLYNFMDRCFQSIGSETFVISILLLFFARRPSGVVLQLYSFPHTLGSISYYPVLHLIDSFR